MRGLKLQQIFQNVIINRQEINSIEFEDESLEILLYPGGEKTFEILITNQGSPTHIHLSVSEELKGMITFLRNNPYVLHKEYVSAVARIPQGGKVLTKGQIFITAGYGSRKKGFPVLLGKVEAKPQENLGDISQKSLDQEGSNSQKLSYAPIKKAYSQRSGNEGLSWLVSPFLDVLRGNFSASVGGRAQKNLINDERIRLNIVFGVFLLLVISFFLYFILPESFQFKVSFPEALLFSIFFVSCITYILLKILEKS